MRRLRIAVVGAAIGLAVGFSTIPAFAMGPPQPSFSVTCALGGDTTVSWSHAKVVGLDIEWLNSAGNPVTAPSPVSFAAKKSPFSTPTPINLDSGGSVHVTADLSSGLGVKLPPQACT